jgi:hypothetical protein
LLGNDATPSRGKNDLTNLQQPSTRATAQNARLALLLLCANDYLIVSLPTLRSTQCLQKSRPI